MQNKNQYKTTSLALAAAIHSVEAAQLVDVLRELGNSRAEFVFDVASLAILDDVVQKFWNRQLMVNAALYFESLKYLKSRLYQDKHVG